MQADGMQALRGRISRHPNKPGAIGAGFLL